MCCALIHYIFYWILSSNLNLIDEDMTEHSLGQDVTVSMPNLAIPLAPPLPAQNESLCALLLSLCGPHAEHSLSRAFPHFSPFYKF